MTSYPDIFFCGDPHGKFDHIIEVVLMRRPHACVLLGDMECRQPLSVHLKEVLEVCPVYWIHGNHDGDDSHRYDALCKDSGHPQLFDLDGKVRVLEVPDHKPVRLAGLGGVFRTKVWNPNIHSVTPQSRDLLTRETHLSTVGKGNLATARTRHGATIYPDTVVKLMNHRADILVTHEAPWPYHPHGFEVITDLAREMGVQYLYHGHHHQSMEYPGMLPMIGRQVGLREVMDLQGRKITDTLGSAPA